MEFHSPTRRPNPTLDESPDRVPKARESSLRVRGTSTQGAPFRLGKCSSRLGRGVGYPPFYRDVRVPVKEEDSPEPADHSGEVLGLTPRTRDPWEQDPAGDGGAVEVGPHIGPTKEPVVGHHMDLSGPADDGMVEVPNGVEDLREPGVPIIVVPELQGVIGRPDFRKGPPNGMGLIMANRGVPLRVRQVQARPQPPLVRRRDEGTNLLRGHTSTRQAERMNPIPIDVEKGERRFHHRVVPINPGFGRGHVHRDVARGARKRMDGPRLPDDHD